MHNPTPRLVAIFLLYALLLPEGRSLIIARPAKAGRSNLAFSLRTLEGVEAKEVEAGLEQALQSGDLKQVGRQFATAIRLLPASTSSSLEEGWKKRLMDIVPFTGIIRAEGLGRAQFLQGNAAKMLLGSLGSLEKLFKARGNGIFRDAPYRHVSFNEHERAWCHCVYILTEKRHSTKELKRWLREKASDRSWNYGVLQNVTPAFSVLEGFLKPPPPRSEVDFTLVLEQHLEGVPYFVKEGLGDEQLEKLFRLWRPLLPGIVRRVAEAIGYPYEITWESEEPLYSPPPKFTGLEQGQVFSVGAISFQMLQGRRYAVLTQAA